MASSCTLCPGGAQPSNPFRTYQLGGDNDNTAAASPPVSCQDIMAAALAVDGGDAECWDAISWNNKFDWQAFCGCPGLDTPKYVCGDYCYDHKIAPAALPSNIAKGATCQEFAEYYPFLLDEADCGGDRLKLACCASVRCSLCPNGEQPAYPDRIYQLGDGDGDQTATSCLDIMEQASAASDDGTGKECWGTVSWGETMDWQTFCGCPGFEQPRQSCGDLCSEHGGNVRENRLLPTEIADGATCQEFATIYPFFLEQAQCANEKLKRRCCSSSSSGVSTLTAAFVLPAIIMVSLIWGLPH